MSQRFRFDSPETIDLVYRVCLHPEQARDLLAKLASVYRCCIAKLGVCSSSCTPFPSATVGLSRDQRELERELSLEAKNPFLSAYRRQPFGDIRRIEDLVPPETLEASEIYQRLLQRTGFEYGVSINLALSPDYLGILFFGRDRASGQFSNEELAELARLQPHLTTAVRVRQRIAELETATLGTFAALDRLRMPVFVVRPDGRVIYLNAAARQLTEKLDGLRIRNHRIEALCTTEDERLRRSIHHAACMATDPLAAESTILISHREGVHAYELLVAPLSRTPSPRNWPVGNLAIITASTLDNPPARLATALQAEFNLTPAEARIAIAIGRGRCITEIAQEFHIAITTAKTHLQRVFSKTGTRRQADLVRLVAGHPVANTFEPGVGPPSLLAFGRPKRSA